GRRDAMTEIRRMSRCRAAVAVAALGMFFAGRGPPPAAGAPPQEQNVKALTPLTTPRITVTPADNTSAPAQKLLASLRNRPAPSPTPGEREQIAAAAALKPSIDIEISFDYRSAKISRSAAAAVNTLGKALSSSDLKGTTFVLAGHTDGKGSLPYNQELS